MSFGVARGTIFGLLGPNGAGKTTILKALTTHNRPTAGRARVLGTDVVVQPLEVRRRISVVLQETAIEQFLSVRDNLLTFARFHGLDSALARRRAEEVLERFHLAPEADRKAIDLSGGYRRRVQVAKVFMVTTPVLFLDEFSTGMDPILKRAVMGYLREEARQGRTIVLTTQILSEAEELCDDILIMNKGRQVARGDLHDQDVVAELFCLAQDLRSQHNCAALARLFAQVSHNRALQDRSEEHTSELQSLAYLVCRLLLEKKKNQTPFLKTLIEISVSSSVRD